MGKKQKPIDLYLMTNIKIHFMGEEIVLIPYGSQLPHKSVVRKASLNAKERKKLETFTGAEIIVSVNDNNLHEDFFRTDLHEMQISAELFQNSANKQVHVELTIRTISQDLQQKLQKTGKTSFTTDNKKKYQLQSCFFKTKEEKVKAENKKKRA